MSASEKTFGSLPLLSNWDSPADASGRDTLSSRVAEWLQRSGDPRGIDFEHTTRIDLSGLALWFFPELLARFERLAVLDLADNLIAFLPPAFAQLSMRRSPASLLELSLARNPLETLPPEFKALHRLQRLDLSDTCVRLPELFDCLPAALRSLDLRGLSFAHLPDFRQQLPWLEVLECNWQAYLVPTLAHASPARVPQALDVCSFARFQAMSGQQSTSP